MPFTTRELSFGPTLPWPFNRVFALVDVNREGRPGVLVGASLSGLGEGRLVRPEKSPLSPVAQASGRRHAPRLRTRPGNEDA